jgi:hypothetical protein
MRRADVVATLEKAEHPSLFAMSFVVCVVDYGKHAPHHLVAAQREQSLRLGAVVERMRSAADELFLIPSQRRRPERVAGVQFPGKAQKLPPLPPRANGRDSHGRRGICHETCF